MRKQQCIIALFLAGLAATGAIALVASAASAGSSDRRALKGTIWVANRGADTIRGFDARTGEVVHTWPMASGSQPGDLAPAKGELYVSEEFGAAPALAVVDPESGNVLRRFFVGITARPHHVHVSRSGRLVAFGLYGTDTVGVVDTRTDTLLGPWDTNPDTTNGRAHAGVFSPNGRILYVTSDATSELIALNPRTGDILWRLSVPNAHELAVTRDGKTAYVSARTGNAIRIVDLERQLVTASFPMGPAPDTLQLSANGKLLTVGLRRLSSAGGIRRHEGRSSPRCVSIGHCSTRPRSQVISGHRATDASRSRRTKVDCIRRCGHRSQGRERGRRDAQLRRKATRSRLCPPLAGRPYEGSFAGKRSGGAPLSKRQR